MADLFDFLYVPDERDKDIFGEMYNPPEIFRHGEWEKIAELKSDQKSDGQDVVVFENRMPARFFKIIALSSPNSIGKNQPSFEIYTGSGDEMGELIFKLASAIKDGMIGCKMIKE